MKTTVDELNVIISANNEEFKHKLRDTKTQLNRLERDANKVQNKLVSGFKKAAAVLAAVGFGAAIKQSLSVGMEAIETASLFTTTLGSEMATEVNKWSMEVADALGLSNTNLQRNIGVIYNIAMAMGVATDNSLKMAKGVSVLAEDMASFYNVDPKLMFEKLQSALVGIYKPLQDLGIRLDEETIKQVAYKKGIAEVGAELNNEQLILARYEAILERTSAAQTDLGRTLESPANQTRIFKNNIQNLWLALSRLLLPAYTFLITVINQITLAITRSINAFADFLGLSSTNKIEKGIESPVQRVANGLGEADKAAKKLKGTLAGFDEMNVLQQVDTSTTGKGASAGGFSDYKLDEYFVEMGNAAEKAAAIGNIVSEVFEKVGNAVKGPLEFLIDNWPTIASIFAGITVALAVWNGYFGFLNAIPVILGKIKALGEAIRMGMALISANPIVAVVAVITGLIAALVVAYNTNEEFRQKVDDTFNAIREVIVGVIEKVKTKFEELKEKLVNVGKKIKEAFGMAGELFKGFKEGLEAVFKRVVNSVIRGINSVISWPLSKINSMLNKIRATNIFGFKPFESLWSYNPIYIPQIPLLERGGILKKGQVGLLEGRGDEAIIPLERQTEWMDKIAERINGNSQPVHITVKIGEETILEKFIDGINEKEFRTGEAVFNL